MNLNLNLVTSCNFRGREYLVSIRTVNQSEIIEVKVTDKRTLEEWLGSFNASYIENLTHKTGNYKRFDTFVSMLKSALLNTSQCVSLDLLKFEDLEMLRSRGSHGRCLNTHNSQVLTASANNRRYLIVTYTVEFDRIHYPLALEYCGPPDPRVLQETIQRLEKQVADLQLQLDNNDWGNVKREVDALHKKVVDVTTENIMLKQEIKKITTLKTSNKDCKKEIDSLLKYTYKLENELKLERDGIEKLKKENFKLSSLLQEALSRTNNQVFQNQYNRPPFGVDSPKSKHKLFPVKHNYLSPRRDLCGVSCFDEKPLNRKRPLSKERKVCSARSRINAIHSSSEESTVGNNKWRVPVMKDCRPSLSPRSRASSPSFSDLSHNSEISRCACKNCLKVNLVTKDHSFNSGKNDKGKGRAKLLKRIQSLEKLISGIVLN